MDHHGWCPLVIKNKQVIPLINDIWDQTFGNKENAMKAIADRGWYPANRMLLDHPDLKKKEILNTPSPNELPVDNVCNAINLENEVASKVMTKIVDEFMKRNGVKKRIENLKKGDLIKK